MYMYYKVLNNNLLKILRNTVFVEPVVVKDYIPQVRLKEEPVMVSVEDIRSTSAFVTAHRLSEYKVVVGNINLVEDITTWLDLLLDRSML